MRSRFWILGLGSLFLSSQISPDTPLAHSASTVTGGQGLRFVPPDELRGIPLAELPYAGYELPARVDLASHMPPPGHQQQQNSCAAWASAYAVKTYQEKIEQRYTLVAQGKPYWSHIFSPAFVYNQIHQGRDGGATLVDALNLLRERGALSWADMPYLPDNITQLPSEEQLLKARRFRIAYWRQVNVADILEVKSQVQAGYPVMVGMLIDKGFYALQTGAWEQFNGSPRSGHAVVVVGYDDAKKAFKVMNSWGPQWGEKGFGWVSYRHFRRAAREAYVAKDAWNTPPVAQHAEQRPAEAFGSGGAPAAKPAAPVLPPRSEVMEDEERLKKDEVKDSALERRRAVSESPQGEWFQNFSSPALLSGRVRFSTSFSEPEIVVRFYRRQGDQYLPFQTQMKNPKYQLSNGQWALKAHLTEEHEAGFSWYRWEVKAPAEGWPAALHNADNLYWQPVFYSDKFGVHHPDAFFAWPTSGSEAVR